MEFNPYLNINQCRFFSYSNIFDNKILQNLEIYAKTFPYENNNGLISSSQGNFRKTYKIKHFPEFLVPLQTTIQYFLLKSNEVLGFNINNIRYVYAEYTKGNSYLKWHNDIGSYPFNARKISFSVNVNGDNEFEGGNLEFNTGEIDRAPQNKGNITIFPSFLLHRVTPITKGVRKVLIGFVTGPPYK